MTLVLPNIQEHKFVVIFESSTYIGEVFGKNASNSVLRFCPQLTLTTLGNAAQRFTYIGNIFWQNVLFYCKHILPKSANENKPIRNTFMYTFSKYNNPINLLW